MRLKTVPGKVLAKGEKPPRGIRVWWIEGRSCWGIEWRERVPGAKLARKTMETRKTKTDALAKAAEVAAAKRRFGSERAAGLDDRSLREMEQVREALGGSPLSLMLEVWARHKGEVLGGEHGLTLSDAVR
ncbi:MAG: hypothetical protein RL077_4681, partial [Verrucomicrobiota bacterium]